MTLNFLSFCLWAIPVVLCRVWNGIQGLMQARQVLCQWGSILSSYFLSGPCDCRRCGLLPWKPCYSGACSLFGFLSYLGPQLTISKRKADGWCFSFYTSAQGTLQKGCTGMGLRAGAWEGGTILVPSSQWLASPECEERTGHLHWHSEPEDTATLLPYPVF